MVSVGAGGGAMGGMYPGDARAWWAGVWGMSAVVRSHDMSMIRVEVGLGAMHVRAQLSCEYQ